MNIDLSFTEYITDNLYEDMEMPEFVLKDIDSTKKLFEAKSQLIFTKIYDGIKTAMQEDLLKVPIIRLLLIKPPASSNIKFNDNLVPYTIILKRDNFNTALQKCLEFFEEHEEYEKCAEILETLKKE